MKVSLVENKLEKEKISSYILNDLNSWFEDEDAVKNYIEKSKEYIFLKQVKKQKILALSSIKKLRIILLKYL
ncbi:MAG: hypothetical protein ACLRVH_06575 [Anaerococcus obesiensis]